MIYVYWKDLYPQHTVQFSAAGVLMLFFLDLAVVTVKLEKIPVISIFLVCVVSVNVITHHWLLLLLILLYSLEREVCFYNLGSHFTLF